ncbi:DUF6297 family protein [Embleya sp. AB8]|uniref:DUF6297 family protein n=1 Tax=Embleya sp. AB8 TaxID=3156304 RepID=UPI003C7483BE
MNHPTEFAATTTRTLAYLRDARADRRRQRRGRNAFALYVLALVAAIWGVPYLVAAAHTARTGSWHGPVADHILTSLPVTAPTLIALILYAAARDALWRGPVRIDGPTTIWLLPLPALRRRLFLPGLLGATLIAGSAGLVGGGTIGFLLYVLGARPWAAPTAAGAFAGLSTGLGAVAVGVLVQRHDRATIRYAGRILAGVRVLLVVLVALSAWTAGGRGTSWPGTVVSWSGPWGWVSQPLLAATTSGGVPAWPVAGALALVVLAGGVVLAWREVGAIPAESLRLRTAVVARVAASVITLDLRQAGTAVRNARGHGRARPRLRLPMPHSSRLLVPWRDATGLLRAPRLLAWAALWTTIGLAVAATAPELPSRARLVACAGALMGTYLAVARLAEPARAETDDIRRAGNLPYPAGRLALWHGAVPALLTIVALVLGNTICAAAGHWHPALLLLPASVPALTAAALISAHRGPLPAHILLGTDTPMGNTALGQATAWYLRGPIAALLTTTPPLAMATAAGSIPPATLLWLPAATAALTWWTHHTAHRLRTG